MTSISGRDPNTGRNVEVVIRDGIIAAITDVPSADPAWLSPGLIDLQINGYKGFDLNADNLTSDTVIDLSRSVLATGVTTFSPNHHHSIRREDNRLPPRDRRSAATQPRTPAYDPRRPR
jgi:N-acetylglucosamine-6-phosphate deacetylase